MGDLRSHRIIWLKGGLFVLLGLLAAGLLLSEASSPRVAALLAIAIWAFCRAYYFAFYVIEKYLDPRFRFTGLWDFLQYAWRKKRRHR